MLSAVMINGARWFDAASGDNADPFYPKIWSNGTDAVAETVDACAAHPEHKGNYHYHGPSPCLMNPTANYTNKVCE
jgi:hypothetical protein